MPRNSGHFLLIAYLCGHESFRIVSMNRFRSIYLKVQEYYDRLPNEKWKLSFLSALPFWVGYVAVGLVAVFYAQMFQWAEDSFVWMLEHLGYWMFLISPLLFIG